MFRKKSSENNGLWDWMKKKLNIHDKFAYDYNKGWFFVVTRFDQNNGKLADYTWVRENFHTEFILALRNNPGRFLMVPAGKAGNRGSYSKLVRKLIITRWNGVHFPTTEMVDKLWPDVVYQQKKKATCMFDGMASALAALGLKKTAAKVHDQARASLKLQQNKEKLALLTFILETHEPWLGKNKSRYKKRGDLDLLQNKSDSPTVAVLESIDGGCNHSVTIVGEWIFDSNEKKALPLCMESLNRCAPPGYVGVVYAIRYGKQ